MYECLYVCIAVWLSGCLYVCMFDWLVGLLAFCLSLCIYLCLCLSLILSFIITPPSFTCYPLLFLFLFLFPVSISLSPPSHPFSFPPSLSPPSLTSLQPFLAVSSVSNPAYTKGNSVITGQGVPIKPLHPDTDPLHGECSAGGYIHVYVRIDLVQRPRRLSGGGAQRRRTNWPNDSLQYRREKNTMYLYIEQYGPMGLKAL